MATAANLATQAFHRPNFTHGRLLRRCPCLASSPDLISHFKDPPTQTHQTFDPRDLFRDFLALLGSRGLHTDASERTTIHPS